MRHDLQVRQGDEAKEMCMEGVGGKIKFEKRGYVASIWGSS